MKIRFACHCWIVLLLCLAVPEAWADKVRVACIGDSITFGLGIQDREVNSYPAQLQKLLGDGYEVRNFGNSGRGVLRASWRAADNTKRAYIFQKEHQEALAFQPQVVICNLGINDVDDYRNGHAAEFVGDYLALLADYQKLPTRPKLFLWTKLAPLAPGQRVYEWPEPFLMQRELEAVARQADAVGIDMYQPLQAEAARLMPDKIHPNAEGAKLVALATAEILQPYLSGDFGGLALPWVYSDHMVLQRDRPILVRGRANAGQKVCVSFAGTSAETVADWQGRWSATLPARPACGIPQELRILGGKEVVCQDVLVGDVWLCAGQSNMLFTLAESRDGAPEIRLSVRHPQIRFAKRACQLPTTAAAWNASLLKTAQSADPFSGGWEVASSPAVADLSGVAWFFALARERQQPQVPVGLVEVAIGGAPVESFLRHDALLRPGLAPLACSRLPWHENPVLQPWCRERGRQNLANWLKAPKGRTPRHPYDPGFIADTALAGLAPFPLAGVLWYQGESNASTATQVDEPMPGPQMRAGIEALVADWRNRWNDPALAFLMVQLPRCNRPWMEFRDLQAQVAAATPRIGLAVTTDLGDPDNVHPKDKRPVGERLARLAAALSGDPTADAEFPRPVRRRLDGAAVRLEFSGPGLKVEGPELRGFEVAGADGQFQAAQARLEADGSVRVSAPGVAVPAAVRYNWAPVPPGNLFSRSGLPAGPFCSTLKTP